MLGLAIVSSLVVASASELQALTGFAIVLGRRRVVVLAVGWFLDLADRARLDADRHPRDRDRGPARPPAPARSGALARPRHSWC